MTITIPLHTVSLKNRREHWSVRARRTLAHRGATLLAMRSVCRHPEQRYPSGTPIAVRLTRIAPRALDTDNLALALSAVRDGVADWLGIDDGDARLTWSYAQERGRPREYAVRVEVTG